MVKILIVLAMMSALVGGCATTEGPHPFPNEIVAEKPDVSEGDVFDGILNAVLLGIEVSTDAF